MAGSVTHYFFANDTMKKVNKLEKVDYDENYLSIFAQSMDTFNFYSIFFPIKKKSGNIRGFASKFHHTKTDEFFYTLINYIKEKKLSNNKVVMSFLYGLITHYVLDSTIHPFVEYKCGKFNSRNKETYKYNSKHHEMETFIDIYMLEKKGYTSKKYKAYKEIFKIEKFPKELEDVIDYTYLNVFNFSNFSNYYLKSIKDMKKTFRIFRYDPYGYKKLAYKVFDSITPKALLNSKFLSYSYIPLNALSYLNNEHKDWVYPYDITKKFNYSFDELYELANKKCADIIIDVRKYIKNEKEIDVKAIFNLSYSTGLELDTLENNPNYEF